MKKYTIIISMICLLIGQAAIAQKAEKEREIGIYTTELLSSNFGAQYKASLKNDWYWTLGAFNANAIFTQVNQGTSYSFPEEDGDFRLGFTLGLEKQKALSEKLTFFTGPFLRGSGRVQAFMSNDPSLPIELRTCLTENYTIGVGWTLGLKVELTDNLQIGTFINPSAYVHYRESEFLQSYYGEPLEKHLNTQWNICGDLSLSTIKLALYYHW